MISKIFSKEYLRNVLNLPAPSSVIEDVIVDHGRWTVTHSIVFQVEDKFYQTWYSVGATEMQDESPWEYDTDIECYEVELREVTVPKWYLKGVEL